MINIEITKASVKLAILQLIFFLIMALIVAILICYLGDNGCEWWQMMVLCVGLCLCIVEATLNFVFLAFVQWAKNKLQNDEQND